ncbi:MAG: hypothetical protein HYT64_02575 [Candidatus Yanofskybacteria bacterium]|nr:hypothetical protein [Candidatus Yanofskybacteria bacterium]
MTDKNLPTKELIIAVVEKDDAILMRKKPAGSAPYEETWYSFGCERIPTQDDPTTLKDYLKTELGIDVEVDNESIPFGAEIKKDHDGIEKNFIYINLHCKYLGGDPKIPKGAERVEWISKDKLMEYDIVPPSIKLFKTLGWLQ